MYIVHKSANLRLASSDSSSDIISDGLYPDTSDAEPTLPAGLGVLLALLQLFSAGLREVFGTVYEMSFLDIKRSRSELVGVWRKTAGSEPTVVWILIPLAQVTGQYSMP
jgi:hypothetical protein